MNVPQGPKMNTQFPFFIFVIVVLGALTLGDSAQAENAIPGGSYAVNDELCKLGAGDTNSMAEFRSRFGSDALLDVDENQITFAAIPAYCEITRFNKISSTLQVQAECNVSGNAEDILFSVEIKTGRLALRVIKGPRDGWFSPNFKKEYLLCKDIIQVRRERAAAEIQVRRESSAAEFYQRGLADDAKNNYDDAINEYTQAIQLNSGNASAFNNRCFDRAIIGQLQNALADCNESLRLSPNKAYALDSRGFAYLKLGQFEAAIADYDAALNLDPKMASSLYGRGIAKLKKGDADGHADITAAKAVDADIANEMAALGVN